jgi:hypothetical protein
VIDQVDHHRDPERIRKQDELLALVAAHLAGFGQDLDRLEPFRLGQLDLLDEGVEVVDQAQHDAAQPRVGRRGKPRQDLGGDVVFGLVARLVRSIGRSIGLSVGHRAASHARAGPTPAGLRPRL